MEFVIDRSRGYSAALLKDQHTGSLEEVLDGLRLNLGIKIEHTLDGIFEFYYDFHFRGESITLNWDEWLGIEIFPKEGTRSGAKASLVVEEIAALMNNGGTLGYSAPGEK